MIRITDSSKAILIVKQEHAEEMEEEMEVDVEEELAMCTICLGELEHWSQPNECSHTFCFICLLKWSKEKASCPVCRVKFYSIKFNIRSHSSYDAFMFTMPQCNDTCDE